MVQLVRLLSDPGTNRIYVVLLVLRLVVALTSLSIIHPDEVFQSPEVAAGLVFNYPKTSSDGTLGLLRTWEWTENAPCRSVGIVAGTSGLAFWLLKLVVGECEHSCFYKARRVAGS